MLVEYLNASYTIGHLTEEAYVETLYTTSTIEDIGGYADISSENSTISVQNEMLSADAIVRHTATAQFSVGFSLSDDFISVSPNNPQASSVERLHAHDYAVIGSICTLNDLHAGNIRLADVSSRRFIEIGDMYFIVYE